MALDASFYNSEDSSLPVYRGLNFLGKPVSVPIVGTSSLGGLSGGLAAIPSGGGGNISGGGAFGTPGTGGLTPGQPGGAGTGGTSGSGGAGGGGATGQAAGLSGAELGLLSAATIAEIVGKLFGEDQKTPPAQKTEQPSAPVLDQAATGGITGAAGSLFAGGPTPAPTGGGLTFPGPSPTIITPGGTEVLTTPKEIPIAPQGPGLPEGVQLGTLPGAETPTPAPVQSPTTPVGATPQSAPAPTTPGAEGAAPGTEGAAAPADASSLGTGLAAGVLGSFLLHELPLEPRLAAESALTIGSAAVPPLAPFALSNLIPDLIGLFNPNSMQFPATTFDTLGASVRNALPPSLPIPPGATPEQRATIQAANDKIATLEPYAFGQTGMGDRPPTLSGEQSPETWQNSLNQVVSGTLQPAFTDLGKLYPAAIQAFAATQGSNPEWSALTSALKSGDFSTARNMLYTAQSPLAQTGIARERMQDVGVPYFLQQAEANLSPEGTWPQFAPTAGGGEETMPNPFATTAPGPAGADLSAVANALWSGYLPNYGTVDNANPLVPALANYAGTFPYNQPLLTLTEDVLKGGTAGGPQFYAS